MSTSNTAGGMLVREGFLLLIFASLIMTSGVVTNTNLSVVLFTVGVLGYPIYLLIRLAMWAMRCGEK